MKIELCKIISLPKLSDSRGDLSFIENNHQIPFNIKRVYYLYNVPHDAKRGAHSHKNLEQLMIAISGSFDITLDDGINKQTYHLNSPSKGLYIPSLIWRDIQNFSDDAVCIVLASEPYDESDYIRDYQNFLDLRGK